MQPPNEDHQLFEESVESNRLSPRRHGHLRGHIENGPLQEDWVKNSPTQRGESQIAHYSILPARKRMPSHEMRTRDLAAAGPVISSAIARLRDARARSIQRTARIHVVPAGLSQPSPTTANLLSADGQWRKHEFPRELQLIPPRTSVDIMRLIQNSTDTYRNQLQKEEDAKQRQIAKREENARQVLEMEKLKARPTVLLSDLPATHAGESSTSVDTTKRKVTSITSMECELLPYSLQLSEVSTSATPLLMEYNLTSFESLNSHVNGDLSSVKLDCFSGNSTKSGNSQDSGYASGTIENAPVTKSRALGFLNLFRRSKSDKGKGKAVATTESM